MNRIIKSGLFFVLALGMTFSSCKKEYDVPPISQLPVGKLLTIDEILTMPVEVPFNLLAEPYGDSVASVCGIVTADEQSGNLYKMIFIQDRATGKAIELVLSTSSAARIGDSVRVFLDKDIIFYNYHNLPQLTGKQGKGFNPDGHLIIYPYNKPIEPKTVTVAEIKSGAHLAALVKIENAEFVEQNVAFCDLGSTTNRTLKDDTGELIARTSNYANFAYDMLPQGRGSVVAIASKYNSDWQLILRSKYEMIFDGYNPDPTPPTPTELEGDGSRENPYTANDVILMNQQSSDGHSYWVKGFIVGTISTGGTENTYVFSQNADINTNIIISSNIDASSAAETVPVQLPVGAVRDGLNLVDHSENYKQEVLLYGTLDKYFSVAGVKNVSYAEINGTSFGTEPLNPDAVIFSETFANGQGSFAIKDVNLPSALTYIWSHAASYSCMKASAYVSQAYASESWLVSPAINLNSVSAATLKFEQAVNYASPQGTLFVLASTDYNGDVATATWNELNLNTWPAGSNWTFISSTADLTNYAGQTVTIAFKYTSTSSSAATWEVKNFVVQ